MTTQGKERFYQDRELLGDDCMLCSGIESGGATPRFRELFPEKKPADQILMRDADFLLIPDDSPVVQDHLLLITQRHVPSCANIPSEEYPRFLELKRKAQEVFTSKSPDTSVLLFEHGTTKVNGTVIRCGACLGVDHAHMHAVPYHKPSQDSQLLQFLTGNVQRLLGLAPLEISQDELLRFGNQPYLYLEENGKINIFPTSQENASVIPSQFIRRLIGAYFNLGDHWDLRHLHSMHRDLEKEMVGQTIDKFKAHG